MFFAFMLDESLQNSLLIPTLGTGISVTTVLSVVIVTVSLVWLTLLCICRKRTVVLDQQTKHLSADATNSQQLSVVVTDVKQLCVDATDAQQLSADATNAQQPSADATDAPLSSSQLHLTATGSEAEVNEGADHSTGDRKSNGVMATLTDGALPSTQSSPPQPPVQTAQDGVSVRHSSPHLPPRNPHRLFSIPVSSSSASSGQPGTASAVAASSLVASDERTTVAEAGPPAPGSSTASGGASSTTTEASRLLANLGSGTLENADYEEVDFHEMSNSRAGRATISEFSDRQYDYIDLRPLKTADIGSSSYAEVERNPGSSAPLSRADAAVATRPANEIPQYAKVDKSRDRHSFSPQHLRKALPQVTTSDQEAASSLLKNISGSDDTLYTEVNKPVSVRKGRQNDPTSPSNLQGENVLSQGGDNASCTGSPPQDGFSDFYPQVPSKNFDEPDYSVIKDELRKTLEEPGYSVIKGELEGQSMDVGYSAIGEGRSDGLPLLQSGSSISEQNFENSQSGKTDADEFPRRSENPTDVAASSNFAKEPLYEDVKFDESPRPTTSTLASGAAGVASDLLVNGKDVSKDSTSIYETVKD